MVFENDFIGLAPDMLQHELENDKTTGPFRTSDKIVYLDKFCHHQHLTSADDFLKRLSWINC